MTGVGNSIGNGDGIESVILKQFLRVSGLVTPFAAGHGSGPGGLRRIWRIPLALTMEPMAGETSDVIPGWCRC